MIFSNLKSQYYESYNNVLQDTNLLEDIHINSKFGNSKEADDWLAKLKLLYSIPFEYLVIQEKMLPVESIKFFYIDNNWIKALADGAMSIGRETVNEIAHDQVLAPKLQLNSMKTAYNTRAKIFIHQTDNYKAKLYSTKELKTGDQIISGFLLRSIAVSEWPGMEMNAYDEHDNKLNILRLDHISDNIIIALYAGRIDRLEICQPSEVLHSGFDPKSDQDSRYCKTLKDSEGKTTDRKIYIDEELYHNRNKNILNIAKLAQKIDTKTSAEFALQMVTGVDKAVLNTIK